MKTKETDMKKWILSVLAIVAWIGSVAVFASDYNDRKSDKRIFQTATVLPNGSSAEGAAWLKRTKNSVDGRVMVKVDKANTPYTIWWVVFNNPNRCSDMSCGENDVFTADGGKAAQVAVYNASGAISAASGEGGGVINVDLSTIAGEGAGRGTQNGPIPPGMSETPPFFQRVLQKGHGLCAEIHLDINEHEFNGDWVQELTYPENGHAFAVFEPVSKRCDRRRHRRGHDDD